MRKILFLSLTIGIVVCVSSSVFAAQAGTTANSQLRQLMGIKPVYTDVDIDTPADIDGCKMEQSDGIIIRDASGKIVRKIHVRAGKVFGCSYFKNSAEVYRQFTDVKDSTKPNEFRWYNNAGTRWGIDLDGDTKIDAWKMISAEEVSAEVIAAIATKDEKRFMRLVPSKEELVALNLPPEIATRVEQKTAQMQKGFDDAVKSIGLSAGAKSLLFSGGTQPGIVPFGQNGEIITYENTNALVQDGDQKPPFAISLGTIVKVGENNWRLIGIPHVDSPQNPQQIANFTFFAPSEMGDIGNAAPQGVTGQGEEIQKLVTEIQAKQLQLQSAKPEEKAALHHEILVLTIAISDAANSIEEKEEWIRQAVDNVDGGIRANEYPEGPTRLGELFDAVQKLERPELSAYVKFVQIMSGLYSQINADDDALRAYVAWMNNLEKFIDEYGKTTAAAKAMMELAGYSEMMNNQNDALKWYENAVADFPNTPIGQKASGAVRRLKGIGQAVPFAANTSSGAVNISQLKGKYVVLYFWTSWSDTESRDLKARIADKLGKDAIQIIAINVDDDKKVMDDYLKANPMPFPLVHEGGGLESKSAVYWGLQIPPMMVLYDRDGKLIGQNITNAASLAKAIDDNNK